MIKLKNNVIIYILFMEEMSYDKKKAKIFFEKK